MPQLGTSTWFITIMSVIIVLFIIFQLKFLKHFHLSNPKLKTKHQNILLLEKQNKQNVFVFCTTRTIIIILIIIFSSILFLTLNQLINDHLISIQQSLIQLTGKQIITIHNYKEQTWTLILISLILFIGSSNLSGLLPDLTYTYYTTLNKFRDGCSSMKRKKWSLTSVFGPYSTQRNTYPTYSYTNNYWNYFVYLTNSPTCTTNS